MQPHPVFLIVLYKQKIDIDIPGRFNIMNLITGKGEWGMAFIKKRYHWLIVGLVLLQLTVHGGTNNNFATLFFLPVSQDFGVSRSVFSLATSLKAISSVLGTFLSGAVLLRFGYRKSVFAFLLVGIAALCVLSGSDGMLSYCIGCVLWGLADGVCINSGPPRIINTWFHRHQGAVLGTVTAATGLGGSLMCLVLSGIIERAGWRNAFMTAAVLMGIVAALILILVRDRPEEKGLKAFGDGQRIVKKKEGNDHWIGYTFQQMRRAPVFYLMVAVTFVSCFFSGGILAIVIPHLQDQGLSASQAAKMQSTMMLVLAAVKFGCGFFSDKVGAKWVTMFCLACTAVGAALFPFVSSTFLALVTVIIFSASLPLTSVMVPLLSSALFGYQAQASCLSIVMAVISLAGIVSGPTANLIFDKTGSYDLFFWICTIGSVALLLVYPLMYKLGDKDKARIIARHQ